MLQYTRIWICVPVGPKTEHVLYLIRDLLYDRCGGGTYSSFRAPCAFWGDWLNPSRYKTALARLKRKNKKGVVTEKERILEKRKHRVIDKDLAIITADLKMPSEGSDQFYELMSRLDKAITGGTGGDETDSFVTWWTVSRHEHEPAKVS